MSDTAARTYAAGDRVIVDPVVARRKDLGVVYLVMALVRATVEIQPEGGGRRERIHPRYLLPAPADGAAPAGGPVPVEAPLSWGTVVRVDRAPDGAWRHPVGDLYVVLQDGARYRLARLGGDPTGRYFRVPRTWLTAVPVESIIVEPGGAR